MERSETLRKFEPLRRRYQKWTAPEPTAAEQAQNQKAQETVERVAQHSVEDFLERGSKLPLDLNSRVTDIVEVLNGETGTLEDTQLAVKITQSRLEEARNARIAADTLELIVQEGKQRQQQLQEQFEAEKASDEEEQDNAREMWAQEDLEYDQRVKAEKARRETERQRIDEKYNYELDRKRKLALDARTAQKARLIRDLREQDEVRTAEFDAREAQLVKAEEESVSLQAEIVELQARLENEPKTAREEAISKASKAAKEEAEAVKAENEAEIAVKDREIEVYKTHNARQEQQIAALETKIAAATEHNKKLSQLAMGKKGEA